MAAILRRTFKEGNMTELELYPTEIVAGVLSNISKKKKYLPTELRVIHSRFYKVLKRHPALLSEFHFDRRGTFPYSPVIDEAFCNLETAHVLPKTNPNLDRYEITEKLRTYYTNHIEDQVNQISEDLRDDIKSIAVELDEISSSK
jgi:hypothetical protein